MHSSSTIVMQVKSLGCLVMCREREGADGTRGVGSSAAKRVTFQTDSMVTSTRSTPSVALVRHVVGSLSILTAAWLSDLRTAIEEEKNIDSGPGSQHRSYVAGITEEGWLPR